MKVISNISKIVAVFCVIIGFSSCDDDFSPVGGEIIGGVNFESKLYSTSPIAYSKRFERVQTSRLSKGGAGLHANLIGVYNDPAYGKSVYSILSQVQPERLNPNLGDSITIDSVVLSVPYYANRVATSLDDDGTASSTYKLDSLYGDKPVKLAIYKSDYFLRDFDPASNETQVYYSDDQENFAGIDKEENKLYEDVAFVPSADELLIELPDGDDQDTLVDKTKLSPRLRVKFDDPIRDKFKALILDKSGSDELSNLNIFRNYFRGIFFKVESITDEGNLTLFDLSQANISIYYAAGKGEDRSQSRYRLNFANNIVNFQQFDINPTIAEELKVENQDTINGEEDLYLKGGNGAYAVVNLFTKYVETNAAGEYMTNADGYPVFKDAPATPTDNDKTELDFLRSNEWLINDAHLTFYVNKSKVGTGGETEPERIYVFNRKTGTVLADYILDINLQYQLNNDPVNSMFNHLGRITRGADKKGEYYKIRLTQHIIDLLASDEEDDNVSLGVAVSQNVNIVTSSRGVLKKGLEDVNETTPTSSIISHEGTVLYGNTAADPNRLKLDIQYTVAK